MNVKTVRSVEVKDAERGEVSVVVATLNRIDSDGDVTLPGAFGDGAKVRISAYGHSSALRGALPVGKGVLREVGDEAIMEGRFFLDTREGADTFRVVKELGEDGLQEWSYGYDPVKYSFGEFEGEQVRFLEGLKVHEVSPVLVGAGVGTRLLAAKSGMQFSEHAATVLADVDALLTRATEVMALRAAKGKGLSEASSGLLGQIDASLTRLRGLLTESSSDTDADEVTAEWLRFVALTQGVAA